MIPSIIGGQVRGRLDPVLDLDFRRCDRAVDPRLVCSGGSGAARLNAAASIVAAACPRIDYSNLVTNSLKYSAQLENAAWVKSSVTPAAAYGPDRARRGTRLLATAADSWVAQTVTGITAGATYTFAVKLVSDDPYPLTIYAVDGGGGAGNSNTVCNVTSTPTWFTVTRVASAGTTQMTLQIGGGNSFSTGETVTVQASGFNPGATQHDVVETLAQSFAGGGLLIEEQRTNKNTNYNAAPNGALTNVTKSGDAAATLIEVNDAAALAAAGLGAIGNSLVFKLDNSAGATAAFATLGGTTGNTNAHSCSAYVRGGAGYIGQSNGVGGTAFIASASYVRRKAENWIPALPTTQILVRADAGQTVYFVLNQLEEGAFCTSPIVTAGAQVTRTADSAAWTNNSLNAARGAWLIEFATAAGFPTSVIWGVSAAGDFDNSVYLGLTSAGVLTLNVIVGGVNQAQLNFGAIAANATHKVAISLDTNEIAGRLNGGVEQLDVSAALPACLDMGIGRAPWGTFTTACAWIRRIRKWSRPRRGDLSWLHTTP